MSTRHTNGSSGGAMLATVNSTRKVANASCFSSGHSEASEAGPDGADVSGLRFTRRRACRGPLEWANLAALEVPGTWMATGR
jgi:hypothetical protein